VITQSGVEGCVAGQLEDRDAGQLLHGVLYREARVMRLDRECLSNVPRARGGRLVALHLAACNIVGRTPKVEPKRVYLP
jgi:hypothetical protein